MPRPKGSKNRVKPAVAAASVEDIESRIAAAEKKAEEEKEKILEAVKNSGKSVQEILDFLK